ncbi:hypothetical protein MMC15_008315 [Xylographa vitiligo]|nr:hypothetical protein [Xylographa vitiligo]
MNSIRQIQQLNKREIENGVPPSASWHADYRDTAYIYIGGLPFTLTEGDVIAIFSQYGEPVAVHLIRDKDTGKSKGFAFLKYEDQRSTELAVDNLGGAAVLGRVLRVDHARYKAGEGEQGEQGAGRGEVAEGNGDGEEDTEREILPEERALERLLLEHDEEDPMKEFLVGEKREEVRLARERASRGEGGRGKDAAGKSERKHRHRHREREREHHSGHTERRESNGDERRRGGDTDMQDVGSARRRDGESHRSHRGHADGEKRSPRRREERDRDSDEDYRRRRRH